MIYALEHITRALREARSMKRLSQRALSAKVGLTQAQISNIENAAADVHLSNLIELARALDLELMLVPRKAVPAAQGLIRNLDGIPQSESQSGKVVRALDRALEKLDALSPGNKHVEKLRELTIGFRNFRLDKEQSLTIESAAKAIQRINGRLRKAKTSDLASIPNEMQRVNWITSRLRELRNALVHRRPSENENRTQPRYRLDDEGSNG